jgi:homoserine acetyltransferase
MFVKCEFFNPLRSPRRCAPPASTPPSRFARLGSLAGHDAFLVDISTFDATVRPWLAARSP